jgi:hypothetical protein
MHGRRTQPSSGEIDDSKNYHFRKLIVHCIGDKATARREHGSPLVGAFVIVTMTCGVIEDRR